MPRKKETLGRRYGVAFARIHFGPFMNDPGAVARGERMIDKLDRETKADRHLFTAEDLVELDAYTSALNVYDAIQMAISAYVFEALTYANRAARLLAQVADAERTHTFLCLRPLLVFTDGEDAGPVDASGASIDIDTMLTDLSTLDHADDPEGFISAIKANDTIGRLRVAGSATLVPQSAESKEAKRRKLQQVDRDSGRQSAYPALFELQQNALAQEVTNARSVIDHSTHYLDRYLFTAQLLETFLGIEGIAEAMLPAKTLAVVREAGIDTLNYHIEMFKYGFMLRYSVRDGNPNGLEAGKEYVEDMLKEAREKWLCPVEWEDRSEALKKAGKAAARDMTPSDIRGVSALEAFVSKQMKKRGLA